MAAAVLLALGTLLAAGARLAPASAHETSGAVSGREARAELIGFSTARLRDPWQPGSEHGPWYSVYTGFGVTQVVETRAGSRALSLSPRRAVKPAQTYAALVRTKRTWRDLDFVVDVRTVAHLRKGVPNPWEVGWVLWHYTDNKHFYYFVAKPNGWELGKEDPAYRGSQRYLATSHEPRFRIGRSYRMRVRQRGQTMSVWVDGKHVVTFTDRARPYRSGSVAFYTEDAAALYGPIHVRGS